MLYHGCTGPSSHPSVTATVEGLQQKSATLVKKKESVMVEMLVKNKESSGNCACSRLYEI